VPISQYRLGRDDAKVVVVVQVVGARTVIRMRMRTSPIQIAGVVALRSRIAGDAVAPSHQPVAVAARRSQVHAAAAARRSQVDAVVAVKIAVAVALSRRPQGDDVLAVEFRRPQGDDVLAVEFRRPQGDAVLVVAKRKVTAAEEGAARTTAAEEGAARTIHGEGAARTMRTMTMTMRTMTMTMRTMTMTVILDGEDVVRTAIREGQMEGDESPLSAPHPARLGIRAKKLPLGMAMSIASKMEVSARVAGIRIVQTSACVEVQSPILAAIAKRSLAKTDVILLMTTHGPFI
jgi:hypothetical protein